MLGKKLWENEELKICVNLLIKLLLVNLFNFQFLKRWVVKNKGRKWNAKTVVNILYIYIFVLCVCECVCGFIHKMNAIS